MALSCAAFRRDSVFLLKFPFLRIIIIIIIIIIILLKTMVTVDKEMTNIKLKYLH